MKLVHIVPERPAEMLRAYRRQALFYRAGIVFIHVPKAAGTSITNAIYGRFIGHFPLRDVLLVTSTRTKNLPRFAVVRNPWDRLLSAYRFARAGRGMGGGQLVTIRNAHIYQVPEAATFERFILRWMRNQNIEKLDGVFRSQAFYTTDSFGKLAVDHIGHVENMKDTEDWLTNTLQRSIHIPHHNTSGRKVRYRDFYTDETAYIVGKLYARDIDLFGYTF